MSASPGSALLAPPPRRRRLRLPLGLLLAGVLLAIISALSSLYWASQRTVAVEINGVRYTHRTHQSTTTGILREMGLAVRKRDMLTAPTPAELRAGAPIVLLAARELLVIHDGALSHTAGHYETVGDALAALDMPVEAHDRLSLEGSLCTPQAPLPPAETRDSGSAVRWLAEIRRPVTITLQRAVAFDLTEGEIHTTLHSTARTVGEALHERGLVLYEGDRMQPSLSTLLSPGLVVQIDRSKPVILDEGGTGRLLRTRLPRVRDILEAYQISLGPKDYVQPDPRQEVVRDMRIEIVRVEDAYYIEEVPIPYQMRYEPDPELDIDLSEVAVWGIEGAQRRRVRVHYENGHELYRVEEEEWIAREARDRIISYGTRIVLRELETPDGTIRYWRHLRMLATSYNTITAGTPLTASWYGYTRLGEPARKGIIAVDPRVIALRQQMYVPGYGPGYAGDTGSAIQWRRIDLCYDEDNLILWKKWVDVYLLEPVPPANQILWMIPNTPAEKG